MTWKNPHLWPPPTSPGGEHWRENESMLSDRQRCTPRMRSMSWGLLQFTPQQQAPLYTHASNVFSILFFFFFLPISSGQHYLPFNHSNSSNQSLPCAVVHQGCNFCNCLRYQLICCDFLIEVVRWKDFHHFNRTCWTTFWFGPVTSQNLHWFPRQLFWTMTLCDVPSSPVKNNKLLFLFSIFLSRLNKEACCVS